MAKILVIDDEPSMLRTVTRILSSAGHEVIEAPNGMEGMKLFRTDHPDIVVTDIFMPKKEGIETILEMRQEHPSTLILAISGGSAGGPIRDQNSSPDSPIYLDAAQQLGADATLAKPFRAEALLRQIDILLRRGGPGDEVPSSRTPGDEVP